MTIALRSENVTSGQCIQNHDDFWASRVKIFAPKSKKALAREVERLEKLKKIRREAADIENSAGTVCKQMETWHSLQTNGEARCSAVVMAWNPCVAMYSELVNQLFLFFEPHGGKVYFYHAR